MLLKFVAGPVIGFLLACVIPARSASVKMELFFAGTICAYCLLFIVFAKGESNEDD